MSEPTMQDRFMHIIDRATEAGRLEALGILFDVTREADDNGEEIQAIEVAIRVYDRMEETLTSKDMTTTIRSLIRQHRGQA